MSLKIWLPLTGNLENRGTANVVCTNDGATINSDGKIGQCYSFNNTHIIVDSTDIQNMFSSTSQPFSMACWIYLNSDETDRVIIFGNYNANPFVNWELTNVGGQRLCVGGTSNYTTQSTSATVPKTTWTHIACTYDGTKTVFYTNGVLIGTYIGANTLTTKTASSRFWLGSDSRNDATRLKGRLNDFRLYDHCLSIAEVKELAQGLLVHYPMTNYLHGYANPNLCNNSKTFGTGWVGTGTIHADKFAGFAVKYKDNTSGTSYSDIVRYPNVVTASQGQIFTASFWAKADSQHDIRCYFYNNTSGVVQVASGVSSIGTTTTSADGQMVLTIPTEWKHFWITWTMNGSTGTSALRELLIGRNNAGQSSVYIAGVKLEEGNADTGWAPSLTDEPNEFNKIQDNSGYNHTGTLNTRVRFTFKDCPMYGYGARLIADTSLIPSIPVRSNGNTFSFSVWLYPLSTKVNSKIIAIRLSDEVYFNFGRSSATSNVAYQFFLFHPSYYIGIGFNIPLNEWHMWTGTYDGTTSKLYKDGVLFATQTTHTTYNYTEDRQEFLGATGGSDTCVVSDLRIYSTCLSADDVMELYNVNTRIDNKGNIHTFEFHEQDEQVVQNSGVFESEYISEFCPDLKYDKNVYVEQDGSKWVRIAHHADPTTSGLFSWSDDFSHGVYYNENKWYDIEQTVKRISVYEFMVKQKPTINDTEQKYRWIQTANPLTATWDDVKAANVTKITTAGYSNNSAAGGLLQASGSTRTRIANASSSNWFGAFGSCAVYETNHIPGYPNSSISTGYMDLYVRIDNVNLNMGASFHKNGTINANQLIEI